MNDKSKNQRHMNISKKPDSKVIIPSMCEKSDCSNYHKFTKFNCIHSLEENQDCVNNKKSLYERKS